MASFPLSGTVTKAPLLVAPNYAQEPELLHHIKYKLYDAGFVVVREEYRLLNKELAEKLCTALDYVPEHFRAPAATAAAATLPSLAGPSPADMIGTVYIFVLAHRDCHPKLRDLIHTLHAEDDMFTDLVEATTRAMKGGKGAIPAASGEATGAALRYSALWTNTSSSGAKQAVSLLFPQMLSEDIPTSVESREYVQATVKTALLPALTDLAKEKPENPIQWLAQRLLETNTHAPPMIPSGHH